jgi:23S rRNA (cytosine1962-C5)-methyltransferase
MPGAVTAGRLVVAGEGLRLARRGRLMVYRKWVVRAEGSPAAGSLVEVVDKRGEPVGCGLYDDRGPVAVRLLEAGGCSFSSVREAVWERVAEAYEARRRAGLAREGAGYRLVFSDGDYLPGLVVDVYDDLAVLQLGSAAWDAHRRLLVEVVSETARARHVYEKSVQRNRLAVGLPKVEKLHLGFKTTAVIAEGEARFVVDARVGQKTGFFLDQRLNRGEFAGLARGRVLDLFSYTGGFGIRALVEGEALEAVFVEEDEEAVRLLERNLEVNRVAGRTKVVRGNVWAFLAEAVRRGEHFDSTAVDPPAFIPRREHRARGIEAYRRLFSRAAGLLKQGGLLFASSCSAHLGADEFLDVVGDALTGIGFTMLGGIRGMPPDHPVRPGAPHLSYLKALFLLIHERGM